MADWRGRPDKYLVLVAEDQEVLSLVPWIEGDVRLARDLDEATGLLDGARGWAVLALAPDAYRSALRQGRLPNYPWILVYTDRTTLQPEWIGAPALTIRELPVELDWLHDQLGQYRKPEKNGTHP